MERVGQSPEPTTPEAAMPPLRGLLELSRLARREPTLYETLDVVAATVSQALGFATAVINVYRPENDEYEVVAVHGSARARDTLLGELTTPSTWAPLLDQQYRRHGVYFVPAGSVTFHESVRTYRPERGEGELTDRSWHPDDALFATLEGSGGRRHGIIAVDDPVSGLRPDDQQLELLAAFAAHAAVAIESARQMAALRAALARNRAVISTALDAVIAVDVEDRLVEFNPAAERTFGYRSEDVLGGDAAELLIPPTGRGDYRTLSQRVREHTDSGVLGRLIQTTAMRSDGSTFPVELAISRVEGAEGEGPMFYGFVRDISERRRGEEQLAFLAYHDALTGLPNRILIEQQLDLALARARRAGGAAALMFVDLDDFKEVNDSLGHAAGDHLLTAVASRLRGVLRDSDVLARQGGDEFLVLLADLGEDATAAAENVGAKLLDALREPFVVAGRELRTGASIGVSLYPDDASDTEALLRHADAAMYDAKAAGGGRFAFHERSDAPGSRSAGLLGQLRAAVANDELELHWQPIRCLNHTRDICGVEALLRWHHPHRGLLAPHTFMNLADQTSAGDELADWVIARACQQARQWLAEGLQPAISVNVSPHQLLAPRFVERFCEHVAAHGLSPASFVLELTESAWSVDSAEALAVIDELRGCGVSLALDDFGAGYSSLGRLRELAFDVIKVDGRMLIDIPRDQTGVKLLLAMFKLIGACRSEIIAEGVETVAQVDFLIAHGVTQGQGFELGHPVPAAELTPLLREASIRRPPTRRHPHPPAPAAGG